MFEVTIIISELCKISGSVQICFCSWQIWTNVNLFFSFSSLSLPTYLQVAVNLQEAI